ncbi:hypothetical protein PM082_022768 [Marasmius tenuissimus]|nr:hypothetical protein PM082_022768 [Marasmius tenuissimus]
MEELTIKAETPVDPLRSFSPPSRPENILHSQILASGAHPYQENTDPGVSRDDTTLLTPERLMVREHMERRRYWPGQKLPVELWRQIFSEACRCDPDPNFLALEDQPVPIEINSSVCKASPLRLSRICSLWRQIIFGFPFLWSSIILHLPRAKDQHSIVPIALRFVLERAGNFPLTLRFRGGLGTQWRNDFMTSFHCPFLQAIAQSKILEINLNILQQLLPPETDLSFPLLQAVVIDSFYERTFISPFAKRHREAIVSSPLLTSITVPRVRWLASPVPSTSVRSIECMFLVDLPLFPIMFPLLASLRLYVPSSTRMLSRIESQLTFPHLTSLAIADEYGCASNITDLLDSVALPSLTHFSLASQDLATNDSRVGVALANCLRRSNGEISPLETLHISLPQSPLSSDPAWISDLVHLSPGLKSINSGFGTPFDRSVMTNTVFYRLCSLLTVNTTRERDVQVLPLPSVTSLTFRIHGFKTETSWEATALDMAREFLRMLESRPRDISKLRQAQLIITCRESVRHQVTGGQPGPVDMGKDEVIRRREALGREVPECVINVPGLELGGAASHSE